MRPRREDFPEPVPESPEILTDSRRLAERFAAFARTAEAIANLPETDTLTYPPDEWPMFGQEET